MKKSDQELIHEEYSRWASSNFTKSTNISSLEGLRREIKELKKEIKKMNKFPEGDDTDMRLEYADCFMYLFDSATRSGYTFSEIFDFIKEKLYINKERDWNLNSDDTYSHIK